MTFNGRGGSNPFLGTVAQAIGRLAQLVERHVYTVDVRGSSPLSPTTGAPSDPAAVPEAPRVENQAQVAQLVELTTENRAVGSSSLPLGTTHSHP